MPTARVESAFWDTSAVALLCTHQPSSGEARRLSARCRHLVVWWGTAIDARSAFTRLHREHALSTTELADALKRLTAFRRVAGEILPSEEVRDLAEAVIDRYPVRAADALQLAAALVLCSERPRDRWFVCFDRRLSEAADLAGFTVMPAPPRS